MEYNELVKSLQRGRESAHTISDQPHIYAQGISPRFWLVWAVAGAILAAVACGGSNCGEEQTENSGTTDDTGTSEGLVWDGGNWDGANWQ